MQWTSQQDEALKRVSAWLKDRSGDQVFRLFGWAGTGKSTLARHLGADLKAVKYAAFTGKAASVMRKRGCKGASTIHSLIYKLESERAGEPRFTLDPESAAATADLIIIDEVSMVDENLGRDLLSFGTKVLVLGDPFQLPPVQGAGFFTADEPDLMLTDIQRQAQDNPIIRMSLDIREGRSLRHGEYGQSRVISTPEVETAAVLAADQVLVGRNKTRVSYNDRIRSLRGLPHQQPVIGDKLVCLKNNPQKKILNGQTFVVSEVKAKPLGPIKLTLEPEDERGGKATVEVVTHKAFFAGEEDAMPWPERRRYDEFTFGYCLTVHKAQGSQWDSVYLFDESFVFRDDRRRWLYTAVTRAADAVTVVS